VRLLNIFFERSVNFRNTTFKSNAYFDGTTFADDVSFERVIFKSDATWGDTNFNKNVIFRQSKFEGDHVSFGGSVFAFPEPEEDACRRAKSFMAKAGHRYYEEDFFYREMVAKRKLNSVGKHNILKAENLTNVDSIKRFLMYDIVEDILFQKIFGYGVRPWHVIGSWILLVIGIFPIFYLIADGMNLGLFVRYIGDSFIIAVAPGYISTIINSTARHTLPYHFVAYAELLMGAFLWACLIATFIKRYMR
jgi:hypothetical protein